MVLLPRLETHYLPNNERLGYVLLVSQGPHKDEFLIQEFGERWIYNSLFYPCSEE